MVAYRKSDTCFNGRIVRDWNTFYFQEDIHACPSEDIQNFPISFSSVHHVRLDKTLTDFGRYVITLLLSSNGVRDIFICENRKSLEVYKLDELPWENITLFLELDE